MNEKLASLCQPSITYRFSTPFWKEDNVKITPEMYAPKSFTPGPEASSQWYKKYVRVLRGALVDAEKALRRGDAQQHEV